MGNYLWEIQFFLVVHMVVLKIKEKLIITLPRSTCGAWNDQNPSEVVITIIMKVTTICCFESLIFFLWTTMVFWVLYDT